jgi:hypothetical protein
MRARSGIFIIISLLFLVGTVSALYPGASTIAVNSSWVIANGVDRDVITVNALNETHGHHTDPVIGATVQFALADAKYGTLTNLTTITDSAGKASSTFRVNTTSGVANITARITSTDGYTVTRFININIDHDVPYFSYFNYPLSATVATQVPFNISITDFWGNVIDNRRGNHIISLHMHGPAPDDCYFVGAGHDISRALDPNGNLSVNVKLTTKFGPNNILIDAFGGIPDKLEWINADNNGVPFSMSQVIVPSGSPPILPADGVRFFTIFYTLYDRYGNPTNGQWIWVNTSVPGEERQFQSNNLGQIQVQYGPRSSIGVININATAITNTTLKLSQRVEFMNTGAEIIALTANPDVMASRDVPPSNVTSEIMATVADHAGNAVQGEHVSFAVANITYEGTYNVTDNPSLLSSSALTDVYGNAKVIFRPGNFTTIGNSGYNGTATGHCNVIASWNGTSRTVPVTWKNYPYISVTTEVNPYTIGINQTVNISITLKGDGWALGPKPTDIVIITNLAGGVGGADRLTQTKVGEKAFIDTAESGFFISLVSIGNNPTYPSAQSGHGGAGPFASANAISLWNQQQLDGQPHFQPYEGAPMDKCLWNPALWNTPSRSMPNATICPGTAYNYFNPSSDAKLEMDFIEASSAANKLLLKDKVQSFNDFGGTNYAGGINMALKQFDKVEGNGHKKALIIMGDGITMVAPTAPGATDSYWPSDWYPRASLGCFDESDSAKIAAWKAADLAKSRGIEVFVLGYPSYGQIDNQTINGMVSPGRYYFVPNPDDMRHYFDVIYGEIREEAGVNTLMSVDFQNINITGVSTPGSEVYDYIYRPAVSTKIGWQDGQTNVTNQTADWAADNKLNFTIGTIKIRQQWNATFQLKVKKSGIIDIFGKNSSVTFNGLTNPLILPQTFITVVPDLNVTEIGVKKITLQNLTITEPGEITAFLPVSWDSTYTGNKTLTEQVLYSMNNGPWVLFDTKTHLYPHGPELMLPTHYTDYASLDVKKLPPGGYKIRVYATSPDAPDAMAETNLKTVGGKGKVFIKLEAPPFEGPVFDQSGHNPWGVLHEWLG